MRGKIGIANAKRAYQRYLEIIETPAVEGAGRRRRGAAAGAVGLHRRQGPQLPDTLYADALIGPDTVDTLPPATIDAFRDHGAVARA